MKCAAFWKHTNIRPGNRIYPCCRFKKSIAQFDGNLETILDSQEYKELRRASENNEWISGCEKCYYEESIGHKSLRQEFNEKHDANEVGIEYLEIGIDNLCNMACDGCNSEFSTSWIAKEKKLYGAAKYKKLESRDITAVPASIKKILFLGGEPLLTDKHLDILNKHPAPANCEIVYNTNCSVIPDSKCENVWAKFKKTSFIASLDGYGEVNDEVREGSKWQECVNFLDWCVDNNFEFEVNTVLHKNSWHSITDLSEFIRQYTNQWFVNVLTFPPELDIINISEKDKTMLKQYVEKYNIPNSNFIINHLDFADRHA